MNQEKTYEMLWDCRFCGAKKLLGKTHRHCPNCGAPQDPNGRYFPPEQEKVAVEDHVYVGVDVHCPACQNACSRAANNCGNCGSPLGGSPGVATRQEVVVPDGAAVAQPAVPAPAPAKKSNKLLIGCGAAVVALGLLAVIAFFIANALWRQDTAFRVAGHAWKHEIEIERYELARESSPCSKMPSGAEQVKRVKQEPVCSTKKTDQGDGTYKEKRECKEQEERCEYSVPKWKVLRTETASGTSLNEPLRWPSVNLPRTGTCEGCERQGERKATYTVRFATSSGSGEQTCAFTNESAWRAFAVGSSWKGSVGMLTGGVDCDSLAKQ